METTAASQAAIVRRNRSVFLMIAFVAFLVANVIHNNFMHVDLAIAPAALLGAFYWWRPNRILLFATAFFVAFPAFMFLKWSRLLDPSGGAPFFNHVALFIAGVFAVLAVLRSLIPVRRRSQ